MSNFLLTDHPNHSISLIVNNLKKRSSRLLRKEFENIRDCFYLEASLWHRSYFEGSVGGATLDIVKKYIENQDTPK